MLQLNASPRREPYHRNLNLSMSSRKIHAKGIPLSSTPIADRIRYCRFFGKDRWNHRDPSQSEDLRIAGPDAPAVQEDLREGRTHARHQTKRLLREAQRCAPPTPAAAHPQAPEGSPGRTHVKPSKNSPPLRSSEKSIKRKGDPQSSSKSQSQGQVPRGFFLSVHRPPSAIMVRPMPHAECGRRTAESCV